MQKRHLAISLVRTGLKKKKGGGPREIDATRQFNLDNKAVHTTNLKKSADHLMHYWRSYFSKNGIASIESFPICIQVDVSESDLDYLRSGFDFELIAEQEDGILLIAINESSLHKFNEALNNFASGQSAKSIAKIYDIFTEDRRIIEILKGLEIDSIGSLDNELTYEIDISVAISTVKKMPEIKSYDEYLIETRAQTPKSLEDYLARQTQKVEEYKDELDNNMYKRQKQLAGIIKSYSGSLLSGFIEVNDSFTVSVSISGEGLKDLIKNSIYIYEVKKLIETSPETKLYSGPVDDLTEESITITTPDDDSPSVVVIDSGIEEGHRLLSPAIKGSFSKCYIQSKTAGDISDEVNPDGHGTSVAGQILFGNDLASLSGTYTPPCFIKNARILDENNSLNKRNPGFLYAKIVQDYHIGQSSSEKSKLFNSSINFLKPSYSKRMDYRSAKIDDLSYENNVLFIQSVGNIEKTAIEASLSKGILYPDYLNNGHFRLTPPAESLNSIIVGSISHTDYKSAYLYSFSSKEKVSSFSRVGPGKWNSIKPDVVEYGGEYLISSASGTLLLNDHCGIKLIKKSPAPLIHNQGIGTSFSTPKITHILSKLEKQYPTASTLLYRALLASSADFPHGYSHTNLDDTFKQVGYGLPNEKKALYSDEHNVTLFNPVSQKIFSGDAHIYKITIPDELLSGDYDVKISITVAYKAKPRRTRISMQKYLSTRLERKTSYLGEDEDHFGRRIFDSDKAPTSGNIPWTIGITNNSRTTFSRNKTTLQKDRAIIKSERLDKNFCVAILGLGGRDTTKQYPAEYSIVVKFEMVEKEIEIYSLIEQEIEVDIPTPIQVSIDPSENSILN